MIAGVPTACVVCDDQGCEHCPKVKRGARRLMAATDRARARDLVARAQLRAARGPNWFLKIEQGEASIARSHKVTLADLLEARRRPS